MGDLFTTSSGRILKKGPVRAPRSAKEIAKGQCGPCDGPRFWKRGKARTWKKNHCFGVPQSFAMLLSAPSPECEPLAGPVFPWSVEGAVKHILRSIWGPPPPPLQPYPVQGMRPLLTPTVIAFRRLGCAAFWVGAGIFSTAIDPKQQCRSLKTPERAPESPHRPPPRPVRGGEGPAPSREHRGPSGLGARGDGARQREKIKMANAGSSRAVSPPARAFCLSTGERAGGAPDKLGGAPG